jgi:hypothetical protein
MFQASAHRTLYKEYIFYEQQSSERDAAWMYCGVPPRIDAEEGFGDDPRFIRQDERFACWPA